MEICMHSFGLVERGEGNGMTGVRGRDGISKGRPPLFV